MERQPAAGAGGPILEHLVAPALGVDAGDLAWSEGDAAALCRGQSARGEGEREAKENGAHRTAVAPSNGA